MDERTKIELYTIIAATVVIGFLLDTSLFISFVIVTFVMCPLAGLKEKKHERVGTGWPERFHDHIREFHAVCRVGHYHGTIHSDRVTRPEP